MLLDFTRVEKAVETESNDNANSGYRSWDITQKPGKEFEGESRPYRPQYC